MTPRTKSLLVFTAVFLCGGVAGAPGMRAVSLREVQAAMDPPTSEARAHLRMEAMRRRLELSDEQVSKIEAILRAAEGRRDEELKPCRSGLDESRAKMDAEILEILSPEQQAQYREFVERKRKKRDKRN